MMRAIGLAPVMAGRMGLVQCLTWECSGAERLLRMPAGRRLR